MIKMIKMAVFSTICFLSIFYAETLAYSQFVNNKTVASSSSTYRTHVASNAVDGNFDQNLPSCSHTDAKPQIREAWLRVDLGKVYSIKSVKIWYRGDREPFANSTARLRGYSLRVSNGTTVPPSESSCYNDPGNVELPSIIKEDCERNAQFVWIYQSNKPQAHEECPMLEICEVQVFGCDVGFYGENCSETCDHCKNNAACGIQYGDCDDDGCVSPRYQPPLCKGCILGMYGANCEKSCSPYCEYGDCDRNTGTCLDGCKSGYIGRFCNQTCFIGKYGRKCSETCGYCLNNSSCNFVNGTCMDGCEAGYKTSDCKTSCDAGEYGHNCQYKCSGNCLHDEVCDKASGHCKSCIEGFQGLKCDRDIRQSPTSTSEKKMDIKDLERQNLMLQNEKLQKEVQQIEADTEILRVRKNVLLKLQGVLSELSDITAQMLKESRI